jgi:hypothetical protein
MDDHFRGEIVKAGLPPDIWPELWQRSPLIGVARKARLAHRFFVTRSRESVTQKVVVEVSWREAPASSSKKLTLPEISSWALREEEGLFPFELNRDVS